MVPEGTIVKKGDWVATLDQAAINQRIQENREELERRLAYLNDAIIDSTISLTNMRQRITELQFELQYSELDLEQAQYESPAYQRRIQTAYNQKVRQIDRAKRDYELRRIDQSNRLRRYEERYNYYLKIDENLGTALEACDIRAPQPGMVVYARVRGRKIRVGDEVSPWRPEIASIPDLSVLVSETYVEEIDISKISVGDSVLISVDAVPGNVFPGTILRIANVGQDLAGFESKVFAVTIEMSESNKKLLPGMTSTNQIIQERIPQQLTIPRVSLFADANQCYVYLKRAGKVWKRAVETGAENDDYIVITSGLEERDRILTKPPANMESLAFLDR
jgi:multidrug efflux pump subunit AcrA (membrane-fusion protein)